MTAAFGKAIIVVGQVAYKIRRDLGLALSADPRARPLDWLQRDEALIVEVLVVLRRAALSPKREGLLEDEELLMPGR